MRFRKKPVEIEAVRWTGENGGEIAAFITTGEWADPAASDGHLLIVTLEGPMRANVGDWIIRGVAGEFYPCKPDIFAATYEPVVARDDS
jgi:hypothetical protein